MVALALGLLAASVALGVFASGAFAAGASGAAQGPPAGPKSPPFTQCPAIGQDSSCEYLIDVTDQSAAAKVTKDSKQHHFDGADDAAIAVQNDSGSALYSIHLGVLGSHVKQFRFDGDGLCSEVVSPKPSGCPFGPSLVNPFSYWGPDAAVEAETEETGTVYFTTPLQNGQYTYFSLEAPPNQTVVAGPVNDVVSGLLTDAENSKGTTSLTAPAPVAVVDHAMINGPNASKASGTVTYVLYSDPKCEHEVQQLGTKTVTNGVAEESQPSSTTLNENETYYWQVKYSGGGGNEASVSCGSQTMTFGEPEPPPQPSVTTMLSGAGQRGAQITVMEGTPVTDTATITTQTGLQVNGRVSYAVYTSASCASKSVADPEGGLTRGQGPTSSAVVLPAGTYYFQAVYSGAENETLAKVVTRCGAEVLTVLPYPKATQVQSTGASASASSPPPSSQFTLDGVRVNGKTGVISVTAQFPGAGTAAALAVVRHGATLALIARGGRAAHKLCTHGLVAVRQHCVSDAPVQYGAGALEVAAPGLYTVVIKPARRALQTLRGGRSLYVTVSVTFQNRLGGKPATQVRSLLVKLAAARPRHHRH